MIKKIPLKLGCFGFVPHTIWFPTAFGMRLLELANQILLSSQQNAMHYSLHHSLHRICFFLIILSFLSESRSSYTWGCLCSTDNSTMFFFFSSRSYMATGSRLRASLTISEIPFFAAISMGVALLFAYDWKKNSFFFYCSVIAQDNKFYSS